jgi:hypothetical protein
MWKVLGRDALYVEIGEVWKQRMMELAGDGEEGDRFRTLMEPNEILYMLNGSNEFHTFYVNLKKEITPEDIQFMADVTLKVAKELDCPYISVNDVPQRYLVIFTNEDEPELIGLNRTEGYGSGKIFQPILEGFSNPTRGYDGFKDI